SLEETFRTWHREQRGHAERVRRLTKDRDPGRVTAKRPDVFLYPFQCGDLVEQPAVRDPIAEVQKAVGSQPVVDRDADHAVASKAGAVVGCQRAGAPDECAAVEPHHDRQATRARVWRPQVEVEAVLSLAALITEEPVKRRCVRRLRRDSTIFEGVTHPVPRLRRSWRLKAIGSVWWRGIRNSLERRHAVAHLAP